MSKHFGFQSLFILYICNFILFFLYFSACTSRKDPSSYLRSSHRDQPDLVKVSSPNQKNHQHSELGKLEHVIDGKNRENDQLRTRLKHNAKGFEALALTVDHLGKKVSSYMNLCSNFLRGWLVTKLSNCQKHLWTVQ